MESTVSPARLEVAWNALVCAGVEFVGPHDIVIGPGCVILPGCRFGEFFSAPAPTTSEDDDGDGLRLPVECIFTPRLVALPVPCLTYYRPAEAAAGPIHVGADNIFEEGVSVVGRATEADGGTLIGSLNVLGASSVLSARLIGHRNSVGARAVLGQGCAVADDCTVSAGARAPASKQLVSCTVLFQAGDKLAERILPDAGGDAQLAKERVHRLRQRHVGGVLARLRGLRQPTSRHCILNFHSVR